MKHWEILYNPTKSSSSFTLEKVITQLLKNRGISDEEKDKFINPVLQEVTIPLVGINEKEVSKAIRRIKKSIKSAKSIVVFGDYDVDGICATAILWEALYSNHKKTLPYIPHRNDEGYGISVKGIDHVLEKCPDTDLIITVDNGIVAYEALEYAKSKNIDVIVTDHHVREKDKTLKAHAIVHTTNLCGTSIAYLLAKEFLGKKYKAGDFLDLVALATVADLVPLTNANRTLLYYGLQKLSKTSRVGLIELFLEAGIRPDKIGVYEIGHIIGPRMNATGRLSSALDSLRLVCTHDKIRAKNLAAVLTQSNKERQLLTRDLSMHAVELSVRSNEKKVIVVAHESYNQGVIGLIASRLVEKYYKPALVISLGEIYSKGSARSIKGVNIIEMIRSVSEHIVQAGGHPMAAGFTVATEKIQEFTTALEQQAEKVVLEEYLRRIVSVDMKMPWEFINYSLYTELQKLSPFGMGNPEPTFVTKNLSIRDIRTIGKEGTHYKMLLEKDGKMLEAIAFNFVESMQLHINDLIDAVYTIGFDTWNGKNKIVLYVKDIKLSIETSLN